VKPTEILLDTGCGRPFPDTFGDQRLEMAAGMLVIACAMYGDKWQPVEWPMISVALLKNVRGNTQPWAALNLNPNCPAPDFFALCERGFARFTESDRSRSPIEFTDHGLDTIRKKWFVEGGYEAYKKRMGETS